MFSEYELKKMLACLEAERNDLSSRANMLEEMVRVQAAQVDRVMSLVKPYSELVKVLQKDLEEARQQNKELVLMLNRAMNLIGGKYATS